MSDIFSDYLKSLIKDTGYEDTEVADAIEEMVRPLPEDFGVEFCPACGEATDFCSGHGESGDPMGHQILLQHDEGDHTSCNPRGCEEANDAT